MEPISTLRKIRRFDDIITISDYESPVVTLFSGGLDSSYLLWRLKRAGFRNVVALCVDLGEGVEISSLQQTADLFGATLIIEDCRIDFAENYVKSALKAHAKYLDIYPISSSLARPLIAKRAVEFAHRRGAAAILHTANQSQNSLRRLNTCIGAEGWKGYFGSPYEYDAITRDEKASVLSGCGLSFHAGRKLSRDANLWCREFESGPLDNPEEFKVSEEAFTWSQSTASGEGFSVALSFEEGELVSIDGKASTFVSAVERLNNEVGAYGHGRFLGLEHLEEGEKVLEVREAPAAYILMLALRHIETATLSAASIALKQSLERCWTLEAVEGRWHSDTKKAAEAGITSLSQKATGTVHLDVRRSSVMPTSIIADQPLYITDRDVWEIEKSRERGSRSISDYNRNNR
jgi:argininosuccinate synthase